MAEFQVSVKYDGKPAGSISVDLSTGCRLYWGDLADQQRVINESERNRYINRYPAIRMPEPDGSCPLVVDIINNFTLGLILEYCAASGAVQCQRLCQARVEYCGTEVVSLKRKQPAFVFDYSARVDHFLKRGGKNRSSLCSELVVGTRSHQAKLVTISLMPLFAEHMPGRGITAGASFTSPSLPSFVKDDPSSIDRELEQLRLTS